MPEKIEELPLTFEKAPSESTTASDQALLESVDMVDAMNDRNKWRGDGEEKKEIIEEVTMSCQQQQMMENKLPNNNHVDSLSSPQDHSHKDNKKSWLGFIVKLLLYGIILALILFVLTSVILYESSIPALQPVRQMPVSQTFQTAYYAPSRAWVLNGYQQFTNTCYEPTKQFISAKLQMLSSKFE